MKRVLKKVLASKVPREILTRKKAGFPVPYDRWMRNELREYVHDTVTARNSVCRQHFQADAVVALLDRQAKGQGESKEVFCLLVLELWYQRFMNMGGSDISAPEIDGPLLAEAER